MRLSWQGWRESNSHQWFWRPMYCHCTTPLEKQNGDEFGIRTRECRRERAVC